ncbi:hypothetical protein HK100_010905 [Physocladia obscura]|uniref:Uncharacterized protein n=1 Tax=Physocladia obscura TaxID=109957 RepID=A0AAD5T1X6_9FUNG|nr:hypothetical protein HK100_010905 [Physocladia obscura]
MDADKLEGFDIISRPGSNVFTVKIPFTGNASVKHTVSVALIFPQSAFSLFAGEWFAGASVQAEFNFLMTDIVGRTGASFDGENRILNFGTEKFCKVFPVDTTNQYQPQEIWVRELKSIQELVELEPDSKWPLMSLVHILHEIGGDDADDKSIYLLEKLQKVDPDRVGYYTDYASDLVWEKYLARITKVLNTSSSLETEFSLNIPSLPKLTRISTPYLLPARLTTISLSSQSLSAIPMFPCARVLNLEENAITKVDGLDNMPLLEVLNLRCNLLQKEGVEKCVLKTHHTVDILVSGNQGLSEYGSKEWTGVLKSLGVYISFK